MKRFLSANVLYPVSSPVIPDGILVLDGNGMVLDVIDPRINLESATALKSAGVVEYFDGILVPGFINAHCHLELSHMKDMIPAHVGLQEFVKQIVSLRKVEPDAIQEAIVAAEKEMMANGIVAVGDISNTLDTLAQKAKHNLAYYTFVELYDLDPTHANDKIIAGLAIQKAFEENCIRASLVPHAPYSVTNNLWKLLSTHFGSHTISMHNQETADENEFFKNKTGSFLGMYERTKVSLDFFTEVAYSLILLPLVWQCLKIVCSETYARFIPQFH